MISKSAPVAPALPRSPEPITAPLLRRRRAGAAAITPTRPPAINHPLVRRHYRVATYAIELFVDLVEHCVQLLIPGALVHARPRIGKTYGIDYVAIHLARQRPDLVVLRMSCEYHRADFEGTFFTALLSAAGVRGVQHKSISVKRFELLRRLTERLQLCGGHIIVLFCDEAQRLSRDSLEWLRDVHDQLGQQGVRLITFLVGQPQLMEQRAQYQLAGDEQIVSRFMIEPLHFRGITDAQDAATCLASYDLSRYPEGSGPTFTEFFYRQAWATGLRLEQVAGPLWDAFAHAHATAELTSPVEIQMDYFTRAVESMLINATQWDQLGLQLGVAHCERAVRESGYVAAQQITLGASSTSTV